VARWTGSDWQWADLAAPTGASFGTRWVGRGFDLAARGSRWMLAVPIQVGSQWELEVDELP
jgi:hypothetical protein